MRRFNPDWLGEADPNWVRRDRTGKFSRTPGAHSLSDIERGAKKAFSADLGNGYSSVGEIARMHTPKPARGFGGTQAPRPPYLNVEGQFIGPTGDVVGTWSREFRTGPNGLSVRHSGIEIDPEHQGYGIGTAFNAQMEQYYRDIGVSQVRLHANNEVGGYAWAAAGYDWDEEAVSSYGLYGNVPDQIGSSLDDWEATAERWHLHPDDSEKVRLQLQEMDAALQAGWLKPSDVAAFGKEHTWTEEREGIDGIPMWPGKDLLLGSSWNGVRSIDQPERDFDTPLLEAAEVAADTPDTSGIDEEKWPLSERTRLDVTQTASMLTEKQHEKMLSQFEKYDVTPEQAEQNYRSLNDRLHIWNAVANGNTTRDGLANEFPDMTPERRDAALEHLHSLKRSDGLGMIEEEENGQLVARYRVPSQDGTPPPPLGDDWYQENHDAIIEHADAIGFDRQKAIWMTAAMSPGNRWDQNLEQAQSMMDWIVKDEVNLTPESRERVARLFMQDVGFAQTRATENQTPRLTEIKGELAVLRREFKHPETGKKVKGKLVNKDRIEELVEEQKQEYVDSYLRTHDNKPYVFTAKKVSEIDDAYVAAHAIFEERAEKKRSDPTIAGWSAAKGYKGFADGFAVGGLDRTPNDLAPRPDGVYGKGEKPILMNNLKIRSFSNNLTFPQSTEEEDVTIDVHMFNSGLGKALSNSDITTLDSSPGASMMVDGNKRPVQAGVKPELADIVRRMAKEWGITPLQAQARLWLGWISEMPPKAKIKDLEEQE